MNIEARLTDLQIEGKGRKTLVMIHGWPDTYRLWDGQVPALSDRYRCVRFTLPGFDASAARRAYTLDEVVEAIRAVVDRRVTLVLHDWGCLYGYQFAMRYPQLVERIVGVDIGDAGSSAHVEEMGLRGKLMIAAYQCWLALAWRVGGRIGDAMSRAMARLLRCPTDPQRIGAQMAYPYAVRWLGAAGGFHGLRVFKPEVPLLFVYGDKKPVMFHSRGWAETVASTAGNRVIAFPTGHWIMVSRRKAFNDALRTWLAQTDGIE
jgi:pimeloyl-ACP methyl ester carboxylesterase